MDFVLKTDGGSRGNPGKAASGWVIYKTSPEHPLLDGEIVKKGSRYLGIQTNNYAEYTALVEGLRDALSMDITELEVKMDSELIVKQLKGIYKVKHPNIKNLNEEVRALIKQFKKIAISHVYRAENKDADAMVNECLDAN